MLEIGAPTAPEPVIVLHGGWGAEHSYLLDAIAPLTDEHRFVLYDQRGSMRTPAPDSTVRLRTLVADLEHLRSTLNVSEMTLIAHSMGSALAYAYLQDHPQRVRGLVLLGPVLPTRFTQQPNMAFIRQVWPEADGDSLAAALQAFTNDAADRAHAIALREGLVPDSLSHLPRQQVDLNVIHRGHDRAMTDVWRISFTTVNTCDGSNWKSMRGGGAYYRQTVANQIMADVEYLRRSSMFWPTLAEFRGPVRVIIGTCDYVDIGPRVWPRIVAKLPAAHLDVITGAGHSIWMDRPVEFEIALRKAIGEINRSR